MNVGREGAVACMALLLLAACDSSEKPTRSECITGYRMDWTVVGTAPNVVLNQMDWRAAVELVKPLTGMAISLDRSHMYLQFTQDCVVKWGMSERLIESWRVRGLDLPKFERVAEPIIPSTKTIDQRGPSWRD